MTRVQDILFSMSTHKPITHDYFWDDEFVKYDEKGNLVDENGYILPKDEFWSLRTGSTWETGWREYKN